LGILIRLEKFYLYSNQVLWLVYPSEVIRDPLVQLSGGHNPENVRVRIVYDLRLLRRDIDREKRAIGTRSSNLVIRGTFAARNSVERRYGETSCLRAGRRLGVVDLTRLTVFDRLHA